MSARRGKDKILAAERLRILFINDMGFQYGAGAAHLRQIQSFIIMGHEVSGLCFSQGEMEDKIPLVPHDSSGAWLGMRQMPQLHKDKGYCHSSIVEALIHEVKLFGPDVIIVGNLHASDWPLDLYLKLQALDALVIGYMHDCYLITGRCAYPETCSLYQTGCNEKCPTPHEYPALEPVKISAAWQLRREIFCGDNGVPMAANSRWTLGMAQRSMQGLRLGRVVSYGLDTKLFSPINKLVARRLLDIPQDQLVILAGAVDISDRRKGGIYIQEVSESLRDKALLIAFGLASSEVKGVRAMGYVRDYRKMPLLYSAADVFLGTSVDEAFGQTFLEASACGTPVVAFGVGGIPEVARDNFNARLAKSISSQGLLDEIGYFANHPERRIAFGRAGREMVLQEYTLSHQGKRWMECLRDIASI